MFNEEVKNKYLAQLNKETRDYDYTVYFFLKSSSLEEELNKDVVYMSRDELYCCYKALKETSINTLKKKMSAYNHYSKWFEKTIDDTVERYRYTKEEVEACVVGHKDAWEYYNNEDINNIINKVFNIPTAFIIYAIYCGIKGAELQELSLLSIDDFDIDNKVVTISRYNKETDSKEFHRTNRNIDDTLIKLAIETEKEKYYYDENGRILGNLESSNYLIKRREGSDNTNLSAILHSKSSVIKERLKRYSGSDIIGGYTLNARSIFNSGIINFVMRTMDLLDITPDELEKSKDGNNLIIQKVADRYGMSYNSTKKIVFNFFGLSLK